MQITVELQDFFSYWPVILLVVIGLLGAALILFWPKKKAKPTQNIPRPKPIAPTNLALLKSKYDALLADIHAKRADNKLDDRQAFQALSKTVRGFVYEATGIKVQNYTLTEIKAANLPRLYELIAQCYVPEFAAENNSNIYELINKARKVVGEWN